ncbi:T-cell immunomodulatory protein [Ceratobasidium sp. AG-Ba]|nr:T-cell immunomodulatory protein [Ceratobasidium sp. AG-Ba]
MRASLVLASASLLASSASAFWPFSSKRFKANELISAGGLGLENVQGRVVALGDLDGDQYVDILVLSEDQRKVTAYLWQHDKFSYTQSVSLVLPSQRRIVNVVPADLNYDGRLDLLLMSEGSDQTLGLDVSLGDVSQKGKSVNFGSPISIPLSGLAQPIVLDSAGSMRLDLLGADTSGKMQLWKNTGNADSLYTVTDSPLSDRVCTLADPHSSAVVDFNGDCVADLFLTCRQGSTGTQSFQIWTRAEGGYKLAREGVLPKGVGAVSFADMGKYRLFDCLPILILGSCFVDRDGTLDLVFPGYSILHLEDILPKQSSLLLTDTSHTPPIPLPLRLGDANLDGFPDILAVTVGPAGVDRVPMLLYNVGGKKASGSSAKRSFEDTMGVQALFGHGNTTIGASAAKAGTGRRTFKPVTSGTGALGQITDARGLAFLDLDEDGTLDILVQRTGAQTGSRISFIQNNFFQDAFFLKAIVLNGACPSGAFGATNVGASFKYTVLDTSGHRSAAFVDPANQLPQTSYQSLHTPYTFIGLGRTNNYIESLTAGSSSPQSATTLEGVIPNSKLVLNPANDGTEWRKELFLRPGDWMWWVLLTLVGATVALCIVVFVLHINEKREDEKERRMSLHHINFDAL